MTPSLGIILKARDEVSFIRFDRSLKAGSHICSTTLEALPSLRHLTSMTRSAGRHFWQLASPRGQSSSRASAKSSRNWAGSMASRSGCWYSPAGRGRRWRLLIESCQQGPTKVPLVPNTDASTNPHQGAKPPYSAQSPSENDGASHAGTQLHGTTELLRHQAPVLSVRLTAALGILREPQSSHRHSPSDIHLRYKAFCVTN